MAERYILHARAGNVRQEGAGSVVESPASPSPDRTPAPERLIADRYLLGTRIGCGRFGPIYSADDTSVSELAQNRLVAVQLLWRELCKHEWLVEHFRSEFLRLRSWRHDNIVEVLDFGHDGDVFYWTTALLDGASLRSIVTELGTDQLDEPEARAVIVAVGEALQYAHARKKVHGAITLENVFVTSDFRVKILDFAPFAITNSDPLRADDLKSGRFAAKTSDDVYGLACLAYELFSGRHPYGGSLPDEARDAELKLERIEALSRRHWTALSRALAPIPEQRTATVGDFLNELGLRATERLQPAEPQAAIATMRDGLSRAGKLLTWTTALAASAGLSYIGYGAFVSESLTRETVGTPASIPQAARPSQEPVQGGATGPEFNTLAAERDPDKTSAAIDGPLASILSAGELDPATTFEPKAGDNSTAILPQTDLEETATIDQALAEAGGADTVPALPESAPAPADSTFSGPSGFEFAETRVTVSEGAAMASLVIRRTGSTIGESAFSWWTTGDTAVADEDYASFGTLIETFDDGEQSRAIHIPLVVDAIAEPAEQFFVELSYDSMQDLPISTTVEIVVLDDD